MVKYLDNNSGFNMWNANQNATAKPKSRLAGFLWWVVLFLGSWWLISMWTAPKTVNVPTDTDNAIITTDVSNVPAHELTSEKINANIQGLRISKIALNEYAATSENGAAPVTLFNSDNDFIEVGINAIGTTAPDAQTIWKDSDGKMVWKNSDGVIFTREIVVDGYLVTVTDTIENKTKHDIAFSSYVKMIRGGEKNSVGVATGAVTNANSRVNYVDWHKLNKKSYAYSTTNGFIGFSDQYWQTVADMKSPDQTMRVKSIAENKYMAENVAAPQTVAPRDTGIFTTTIFAGPREQRILDAASTTISGLDETIDYGWFWFFARPLLWILNVLNAFVMNYGLAIILLTILLRLLMWPLTRKSYTSSIAMQRMQPELQRIQKLYANDKARLQLEMMNLYRTHKTSPMSGCLPMLIQIPIFFALYKALLVSVNMRNAHFLWINDLAAMDPYFILPILMGATMWLQQYMQSTHTKKSDNPNDVAAATARTMKWLPIIFTIMFAWMPAGLVLYWTVSNVFGIFQMYVIKKQLNKK